MTIEEFLVQLAEVRRLAGGRLVAIRRGDRVHGTDEEILLFLSSLDDAEREARTGDFKYARGVRALPGAREILDTWPFEDELGAAYCELSSAYRRL